jgi:hypothetical protein
MAVRPGGGVIAAATAYLVWTWALIGPMRADATAPLAAHVDPTRPLADSVIMLASVGSLAGVGYLLIATKVHDAVAAVVGIAALRRALLHRADRRCRLQPGRCAQLR